MKKLILLVIFSISITLSHATGINHATVYEKTKADSLLKSESPNLDNPEFLGTVVYTVPDALGSSITLYLDVYWIASQGVLGYYHNMRVEVDGISTSATFYDGSIVHTPTFTTFTSVTIYYYSYLGSGSFVVPNDTYSRLL